MTTLEMPQQYKEILLLKHGELVLKGLNRRVFEKALEKNLIYVLEKSGDFSIRTAQSTVYIEPKNDNFDIDQAYEDMGKVFGLGGYSRACVVPKDFDEIAKTAVGYLKDELLGATTFKVEAKRSDKNFPLKSPELSAKLGEYILRHFDNLSVDVRNPELLVVVEVRDAAAYIHLKQQPGAGGMPVGTSGHAMLLLSGGIDSPVAGYMMAKRGLKISAVHFESPPYTSSRAKQKVKTLLEELTVYAGSCKLYCVPFTEIQEEIGRHSPEEYGTVLMRRYMMRIAAKIAEENDAKALITGESLGQVASQTIEALGCTDAASSLPVFRPLIGMDKKDIVEISVQIGTYETSILPFEDCCTVFTPKRPCIHPRLEKIMLIEERLGLDELVKKAVRDVEIEML